MTGSAVVDLPFLALVVWAAVLEAQRARRGTPVLVLLAAAGLLRPEAWLLAAGYALWVLPRQHPRQRLITLALAAGAPLIWATADLLLHGRPALLGSTAPSSMRGR